MVRRTIRRNRQRDSGDNIEVIDVAGIDGGDDNIEIGSEVIDAGIDVGETDGTVGSESFGPEIIDPATIGVERGSGTGEQPRRRGRKPGTKNKPKVASFQAGNLEKLLLSGHIMLAAVAGASELVIDESEAKLLAESIAEVNAAYGLDSIISPKIAAVVDLSFACAAVYGPRLMKIAHRAKPNKPVLIAREREKQERGHAAPQQPITIVEAYNESKTDVSNHD